MPELVIATRVLSIGGYEKVVNLAESLFSEDTSSATYIAFTSDRNLVGFQLNGSADGQCLMGYLHLAAPIPRSRRAANMKSQKIISGIALKLSL